MVLQTRPYWPVDPSSVSDSSRLEPEHAVRSLQTSSGMPSVPGDASTPVTALMTEAFAASTLVCCLQESEEATAASEPSSSAAASCSALSQRAAAHQTDP